MVGQPNLFRRARGYAPMPIASLDASHAPLLAAGGHLKNTVGIAVNGHLIMSPHLGDLVTAEALLAQNLAGERRVRGPFKHLERRADGADVILRQRA